MVNIYVEQLILTPLSIECENALQTVCFVCMSAFATWTCLTIAATVGNERRRSCACAVSVMRPRAHTVRAIIICNIIMMMTIACRHRHHRNLTSWPFDLYAHCVKYDDASKFTRLRCIEIDQLNWIDSNTTCPNHISGTFQCDPFEKSIRFRCKCYFVHTNNTHAAAHCIGRRCHLFGHDLFADT